MEKKILLATFEKVAAENGYEVFTPDEIAGYYKDGLQKSLANELTPEEKEVFAADIAFLNKSICIDEHGKEVIRYYRPEQVKWESSEDGLLLKGVAGVYADTPTNRKLNRVGEPYIPHIDFLKSLEIEEGHESIIKAARTGRYADTPENRRLHRVGQPYANRESKGAESDENQNSKKANGEKKKKKTFEEYAAEPLPKGYSEEDSKRDYKEFLEKREEFNALAKKKKDKTPEDKEKMRELDDQLNTLYHRVWKYKNISDREARRARGENN